MKGTVFLGADFVDCHWEEDLHLTVTVSGAHTGGSGYRLVSATVTVFTLIHMSPENCSFENHMHSSVAGSRFYGWSQLLFSGICKQIKKIKLYYVCIIFYRGVT